MRILIVGAGAIGGVMGGYLTRAGKDVTLVDRAEDHVEAMRARGLLIDGVPGELVVRVNATTPAEVVGDYDLILIAVKSRHTQDALKVVVRHLAPSGIAVSVQNGLANKSLLADAVGPARALGAMVRLSAAYRGPGHVSHINRGLFVVGELDGRRTERLEQIRELLDLVAPAQSSGNLFGWLWAKETYNCFVVMTALVDDSYAHFLELPGAEGTAIRAMRECATVAQAEGVRLEAFDFFDPNPLLSADDAGVAQTRRALAEIVAQRPPDHRGGVWRDIAVRRIPTEVPFTVGEVIRRADRHGLAIPVLRRLVEMIDEIERGERMMSPDNIAELAAISSPVAEPSA